MIKNYFKIAWRNLVKNKVTSFINVGGLSVGLAVGIIIMLWVSDEYSYNTFHAHLPHIYMMMQNEKQGAEIFTSQSMPGPLAGALRSEMPEIKYTARVSYSAQQLMNTGAKSFYENGIYAEADYFSIMSFPAVAGDPQSALRETGSIVITESTAKKLFGKEDPMGKVIIHNNTHNLKVGAVIKDVPTNSSFNFDVVLPFSLYEKENSDWINKWNNNALLTWVQLKPETNLSRLNGKLNTLFQRKRDDTTVQLFAYPFAELAMHGKFKNGKPHGGRIEMLIMLSILGMFVLVIACINFMNLSTAHSEGRAREVGVRKSLGASKKSLIFQFLSEAFLMTFLALATGILLANMLLPGFNDLTGKNVSFDMWNWRTWSALLAIGVFTALLAGSYPAFFFKPFSTRKGFERNGNK